jgi:endonuclease/exonuclease/phosphatase family metal-dependent hydrolase
MASVKVATLNLFNRMGEWGHRAPLVIDQLEALLPDVIGLQEVDMVLDQGMWISKQINTRLPGVPHYRIKHAVNPGQRASFLGIATMSRIGFEEHDIVDLMTHERNAQRFVFMCGDRPFFFVNTHLHWPPEAKRDRVEQLEYLLRWLDRDPRKLPTIILGDFNAYAEQPEGGGPEDAVLLMKERFRSAVEVAQGKEPEKTWTTPVNTYDPSPHGTLDYIFISEEWKVEEAGLAFDKPATLDPNMFPSDHLGLYAVLSL